MKPTEDQIRQWARFDSADLTPEGLWRRIAHAAYVAGADAELEACCQHIRNHQWGFVRNPNRTLTHRAVDLLWARRPESRPKPPSLKQQALEQLDEIQAEFLVSHGGDLVCDTIRRALEALPDDTL
jgi:hypothetical protein